MQRRILARFREPSTNSLKNFHRDNNLLVTNEISLLFSLVTFLVVFMRCKRERAHERSSGKILKNGDFRAPKCMYLGIYIFQY